MADGQGVIAVGQALFTFKGENERELSFEKGQEIKITSMDSTKGWWEGIVKSSSTGEETRGFFSKNYVSVNKDKDNNNNTNTNTTTNNTLSSSSPLATSTEIKTGIRVVQASPVLSPGNSSQPGTKKQHVLGPPQPGQYPWSKTFVCSCGARLPSPEVANVHIKNFNK